MENKLFENNSMECSIKPKFCREKARHFQRKVRQMLTECKRARSLFALVIFGAKATPENTCENKIIF